MAFNFLNGALVEAVADEYLERKSMTNGRMTD